MSSTTKQRMRSYDTRRLSLPTYIHTYAQKSLLCYLFCVSAPSWFLLYFLILFALITFGLISCLLFIYFIYFNFFYVLIISLFFLLFLVLTQIICVASVAAAIYGTRVHCCCCKYLVVDH